MLKTVIRVVWTLFVLQSGLVLGQTPRLDGSTDKAADDSFAAMVKAAPAIQRQALLIALVQINMEGVQSAEEAIKTDASRHPSAARVRLKINGMTADEIIALGAAAQTTTPGLKVKIDDRGDDPGVPADLLRPFAGGAPREQLAGTTWDIEQTANGTHEHFVYPSMRTARPTPSRPTASPAGSVAGRHQARNSG
jgi:hypothetical protein